MNRNSYLDSLVRNEEEIILNRMNNSRIHNSSRRDILSTTAFVLRIVWKEASVVTLLHYHKCNRWLVAIFQTIASLADGRQLPLQYLKLMFKNVDSDR